MQVQHAAHGDSESSLQQCIDLHPTRGRSLGLQPLSSRLIMALTIRTFRFLTETKLHCNGGCAHHTAIHCTTKLTRRHRHVSLLLLGDATVAIGTHLPTKLDLPKLRVLLCNGKYRNLSAPATAMSPCRLAGRLFVAQKFQDSRPGLTAQLVQSPAWDSSLPPSKQWIRKYLAPDNT